MLVIPLTDKTSWQNPPWITICLILINAIIFFGFQGQEGVQHKKITSYYIQSGLYKAESAHYLRYLKKENRLDDLEKYRDGLRHYPKEFIYWTITNDREFSRKLENDQIITPRLKIYPDWKKKREKLAGLVSEIFSFKYGYRPALFNWLTPFTYMFLHGSVMHLVGNMVFLWLVGSILELSCRRSAYLFCYLVTGYVSAIFFGLIYSDSTVPLIGASGAIAGLMGAFTVIYGLGRIRVFYSLGFYFNYGTIPAWILLPFWIGNELVQLFWGGPSNVAYVGHIGGLTSGALLGLVQLKLLGPVTEEKSVHGEEAVVPALMESGMKHLAELDFANARTCFAESLKLEPQNRQALLQLYKIDKTDPSSEQFHKTAIRLLTLLCKNIDDGKLLLETYREHHKLGKPRLSKELYSQLCLRLASIGETDEASRIIASLHKRFPHLASNSSCLLTLAKALLRKNETDKGRNCLKLLCQDYPDSAEYRSARALLEKA